jgi:hypothetical protein
MPLIIPSNSISAGGFAVDNSLRFDDGSSDHLSKTFGTTQSDAKKITISAWCKLGNLGSTRYFFGTSADGSYSNEIGFNANDKLEFFCINNATNGVTTSRVFRDVSAWYHVVAVLDTTQATSTDRIKIYVNGVQETAFDSTNYPSLNAVTEFLKNGGATRVGDKGSGGNYYDGYLAEFCVLDGQALDPTSFGEFDEDSGIWKPIDVSGLTFGTNGFYLDFEDSSALGDDVSGNGNDFTVNNLTSIDQTTDTPTNNFATMNVLTNPAQISNGNTFSDGNCKLSFSTSAFVFPSVLGTIGFQGSGKWYWEVKYTGTDSIGLGVFTDTQGLTTDYPGSPGNLVDSAFILTNNSAVDIVQNSGYTANVVTGLSSPNIFGIAYDVANAKLYFTVNGTEPAGQSISSGTSLFNTLSTSKTYLPVFYHGDGGSGTKTGTIECNFGNPPFTISSGNSDGNGYGNFEYAVPSGYYSLNTKNLSEFG